MISLVVLSSFVYLASASVLPYGVPSSAYAAPVYDQPIPYNFAFDVKDEYGTTLIRQEKGDELGNKIGSYGYVDAYGISRQVDYVADDKGFRAVVKTNEPGTESQNPADVELISSAVPAAYATGPISGQAIYGVPAIGKQTIRQVPSAIGLSPYGPVQNGVPLY